MSIKVIFDKKTIKFPSGSGFVTCKKCDSKNAYMDYGMNELEQFCFNLYCFDCKFHDSLNWKK